MKKLFNFNRNNTTFEIETNGKTHNLAFGRSGTKHVLYVDGEYRETFDPSSIISSVFGDLNDYFFSVDGVPVVLAARFGRLRIAVSGKYTDTGDDFRPVLPLPWWGSIFAVLAMLPPVFFRSTLFDYIVALGFVYICTHYIIKNPDFKLTTRMRIVYCIVAIAISWAFFGLFLMMGGGVIF